MPHSLTLVSWIALALGLGSALVILVDELVLGHRQHMDVMDVVHPVTALYWGPVWLWAYFRHGRRSARDVMHREAERLVRAGAEVEPDSELRPWHVANAVSHCGAGCTLGDIGGEWLLFAIGAPMLGALGTFGWELVADFALAWTLGIAFQYFTLEDGGVRRAIKVDTASILAFQVGLFGWMALSHFVLFQPPLKVDTSGHWFMMQVGMIVGFFTAWPVNLLLVRRGIKEKMDPREHLAMMVTELREQGAGADEPVTRDRSARSEAGGRAGVGAPTRAGRRPGGASG